MPLSGWTVAMADQLASHAAQAVNVRMTASCNVPVHFPQPVSFVNPGCRVAFLVMLLSLSSSPALAGESVHLRASDVHDAGYPTVRGLQAMSDRLDVATGGRIHLKIYPGAQLGDERDMLEMTIFGGIDISRTSIAPLNSIVPETGVFSLPFLFRSTDHMRRVLDGPVGDEILAGLEPHGLIGLAYYDAGARNLYNRLRPVRSPADMQGMKIRVMNSMVFVDMISTLGARRHRRGRKQLAVVRIVPPLRSCNPLQCHRACDGARSGRDVPLQMAETVAGRPGVAAQGRQGLRRGDAQAVGCARAGFP